MSLEKPGSPPIGLKLGLVLYAVLLAFSFVFLHGTPRALCLIIVGALLVKSVLHHLRSRLE